MNNMERKEYKKPSSECLVLAAAVMLENTSLEISDTKGDPSEPLLTRPGYWDTDEE